MRASLNCGAKKGTDRVTRGGVCPGGLAQRHPAAEKLLEYATKGCPARTGRNWTREEMQAAVDRGNHASAKANGPWQHL